MPNPGNPIPNGQYAARLEEAKKIVKSINPEVKAKIKEMYPVPSKETVVKQILEPKQGTQKDHYVTGRKDSVRRAK